MYYADTDLIQGLAAAKTSLLLKATPSLQKTGKSMKAAEEASNQIFLSNSIFWLGALLVMVRPSASCSSSTAIPSP